MTRSEWRRLLDRLATQRPMIVHCVRLDTWTAAVAACPPHLRAETAARSQLLIHGTCAGCGVAIVWEPSTPLEPLKYCEPCGTVLIENPDAVFDAPAVFDPEPEP